MLDKRLNAHGLTEKQDNFCLEYIKNGGNAAEAYRATSNVKPTTKSASIWAEASKLLANPKVTLRIQQLKADAASGRGVTVETLIDEYAEAYRTALNGKQPAAMVAAVKAKAELLGLQKQTLVVQDPEGQPLRPVVIELVAPGYAAAQESEDD